MPDTCVNTVNYKYSMKKGLRFLAAAVAVMSLAACNDKFDTEDVFYSDSFEFGKNKAECEIEVDFPKTGNKALSNIITGWAASQIAESTGACLDNITVSGNGQEFAKTVTDSIFTSIENDFKGFEEAGFTLQYSYKIDIEEEYTTGRFVTYTSEVYAYTGGAHGNSTEVGAVFGLKDGRIYGWDIFKEDSLPAILELVKDRLLKDYFEAEPGASLGDFLLDGSEIGLPVSAPYFTEDGVKFIYQNYEIAPYAAGRPSCTIPYSQLKNFFTADAKALL